MRALRLPWRRHPLTLRDAGRTYSASEASPAAAAAAAALAVVFVVVASDNIADSSLTNNGELHTSLRVRRRLSITTVCESPLRLGVHDGCY